jgi:hypothetical protein
MGLRDEPYAARNITYWKDICYLTFSALDEHDFHDNVAKPWPWNLRRSDKLARFAAFVQEIEDKGYFDAFVAPQTMLLLQSAAYTENAETAVFRVDSRNDSVIGEHPTSEGCIADLAWVSEKKKNSCKPPFSAKTCEAKKCKELVYLYHKEWNFGGNGVRGDNYCVGSNQCSENDIYNFCYHNGARNVLDPWDITMDDLLQRPSDGASQRGVAHLLRRICLLYIADYQCLPLQPPVKYFTDSGNCELKPEFQ